MSEQDPDAAMFGPFAYYLDPARGAVRNWSNRLAVMSWEPWLTFDAHPSAQRISCPTLIVHSEQAAVPAGAHRFFEALRCPKDIAWLTGDQFSFYDDPATVRAASDRVAHHFWAGIESGRAARDRQRDPSLSL